MLLREPDLILYSKMNVHYAYLIFSNEDSFTFIHHNIFSKSKVITHFFGISHDILALYIYNIIIARFNSRIFKTGSVNTIIHIYDFCFSEGIISFYSLFLSRTKIKSLISGALSFSFSLFWTYFLYRDINDDLWQDLGTGKLYVQ